MDIQTITGAASIFMFAVFLATANERIIEQFIKPMLIRMKAGDYVAQVSLLTGVLIAIGTGVDLITPLAVEAGVETAVAETGVILTGLLIGGGSNFLHDIWPIGTAVPPSPPNDASNGGSADGQPANL